MLKKTITYKDFNDVERTEDFYFGLSEAELIDMQMGTVGGFSEYVSKIIATKDVPSIVKLFKELILKSYGEKSADGRRFIKKAELSEEFSQTNAFSKLYMELAKDDVAAAAFVKGIIPADLAKQVDEEEAKQLVAPAKTTETK